MLIALILATDRKPDALFRRWDERFEDAPLSIAQVCRIRLSRFHTGIVPQTDAVDQAFLTRSYQKALPVGVPYAFVAWYRIVSTSLICFAVSANAVLKVTSLTAIPLMVSGRLSDQTCRSEE